MKTSDRIIDSAIALLDSGGMSAVTLRAVGQASGLSHNAPYKHFDNRDSLLGAIATQEFQRLAAAFRASRQERVRPLTKLKQALQVFSRYGRDYPNRYQLLFSDPDIAKQGGDLQQAAMASFSAFAALIAECQTADVLPGVETPALAGLIYASVHGLINLQASGRMRAEKGFMTVDDGVTLLLKLLAYEKSGN
ncbi:TetR/AcrR family transcriptional regulator [Caballeronia sp. LZ043]|uniref:TetR/AcrR family transcriptional regulator n=1 Tax=Caballeronia sp. LZ043 TaxID=3038569 RepID=UPI002864E270|nr:TetR/AcrR family transcriptional regulator [Caballeronia sp. LZ043]MDR5822349.1 TetR/AcrR family transcriptional regulator [Caballeronia sp. LZ043]